MSTILLVGAFLFADEKTPLSPSLKRALYSSTLTCSVITSILHPPNSFTIITYANAFLSVAYTLRAVELLIINQPRQLERLIKIRDGSTTSPVYVWEPMPPALSYRRLFWICDLLINPRNIGWAHGSGKYLPQLEKLSKIPPAQNGTASLAKQGLHPARGTNKYTLKNPHQRRLKFLAIEALKLVIAYFLFDAYRTFFGRRYPQLCTSFHSLVNSAALQHFESQYLGFKLQTSLETSERFVRRFLLPPACWAACYGFVDGIRAAVALFAVGGLYVVSPSLAADPWMYPAIFGSWRYIIRARLKDIWGKLWHDLCRRALINTSMVLIPRGASPSLRRVLVGFLSFILSGVVHAAGTYAVIRDTYSVIVMMMFFFLLPFYIAAQEVVRTHLFERFLPDLFLGRALLWTLDAAYVIWWGYHTAPWFFRYSMIPESVLSIPVPVRWSLWHA
ncbi:hypothetical protein BDW74DRAFT_87616 [Aspergillus multicolor]|uniref:wax synthase family protein n=1 Tax=Aspergillus multicolor TaxID=41759 RepID=UPI003CCCAD0D